MKIVRVEVPSLLVNRTVNDLTVIGEIRVVAINRNNKTFIPTTGTKLNAEDILYISVISSATNKLRSMLDLI